MRYLWTRLFSYAVAFGIGFALGTLTFDSDAGRDDGHVESTVSVAPAGEHACPSEKLHRINRTLQNEARALPDAVRRQLQDERRALIEEICPVAAD